MARMHGTQRPGRAMFTPTTHLSSCLSLARNLLLRGSGTHANMKPLTSMLITTTSFQPHAAAFMPRCRPCFLSSCVVSRLGPWLQGKAQTSPCRRYYGTVRIPCFMRKAGDSWILRPPTTLRSACCCTVFFAHRAHTSWGSYTLASSCREVSPPADETS